MRRSPILPALATLLAALSLAPAATAGTVLELDPAGQVRARTLALPPPDPAAPAPAPRHGAPRAGARAAKARTSVPEALDALLGAGQIDQASHDAWTQGFAGAKRTLGRLTGARRAQLSAVLDDVRALAAGGRLTATRAPLAFLVLARNRAWWAGGPLLRYGQRVTFAGSELIWQFYPGQGIQPQWLGTFGRANALFAYGGKDEQLRALLDEALPLATARAGGIAWEGLFRFDGGAPPWASSLTQGTALQAYSRAAARLKEPRYFEAARAAMQAFAVAPPAGVRVATPAGAHYAQYTFAPQLRILNGFIQSLNGLSDFAKFANDDQARGLFAAGEAEARAELPAYDTGAWSLYRPGKESDLGYHTLLRDFVRGLCARLRSAPPPAPDPAIYCDAADRFAADLRTPPVVALKTTRARLNKRSPIRFELSKVSTVTLTLRRAGKVVASQTARVGYGRRAFAVKPSHKGVLSATLRAVDLAGNAGGATGSIAVRRAK